MLNELRRELRFAWGEAAFRWAILLALVFSAFSVFVGVKESTHQQELLSSLIDTSMEDQQWTLEGRTDVGDIAYNIIHLTYDPPSSLAFAALGLRDELPWKHRLRMLALEGQIHETDGGNPELSALGQLDFSYLVSVLLPLFVIGLLFDLDARERRAGRYELLCATSVFGSNVFLLRAVVRGLVLFCAMGLPFLLVAVMSGVAIATALLVLGIALLHIIFWVVMCRLITTRRLEGVTAALTLLSFWFLFTIVVPVGAKTGIEDSIAVPNGGDILLTQRETVNDAWDLPKAATMEPFLSAHPKWTDYAEVNRPFEWKWYYAFQEVGDQAAQPLSTALYAGMTARDQAMAKAAMLSPALLSERALMALAETDVSQHLQYIACARDFHARLRHFYYPLLFGEQAFSEEAMAQLPRFQPCAE